jgi:hypothetical protein
MCGVWSVVECVAGVGVGVGVGVVGVGWCRCVVCGCDQCLLARVLP